jgi:flagellar protein FliO/FliZ
LLELVIRIGFSLLVVLAIMWLLAKATRKRVGGRHAGALSVLSRQSLSRGASVAVVRVVDRALVLGITENQVTLLGETDLAALVQEQDAPERRDAVPLPSGERVDVTDTLPASVNAASFNAASVNAASVKPKRGMPAQGRFTAGQLKLGRNVRPPAGGGALDGSLLSGQTWRSALDFLRERTVRS